MGELHLYGKFARKSMLPWHILMKAGFDNTALLNSIVILLLLSFTDIGTLVDVSDVPGSSVRTFIPMLTLV